MSDTEPDSSSSSRDLTGTKVGRFSIGARLGAGGMGEVYRAEDGQLRRTVAIKRVVPGSDKAVYRNQLLKEAQRASALNHPRIASVYDVFVESNELFLVMEYIDGETLRERMERPITLDDFFDIAVQCGEALVAAQKKGIRHGDLKPANIMLTRDTSEVKVCDFGLAHRIETDMNSDSVTTLQGIAGTPAYMPPEVMRGQAVDGRADIFSLGVVFYEMLSGHNPFAADNIIAMTDRIRNQLPQPLNEVNPQVSPRLSRIVARMLEKSPDSRYRSAAELLADLTEARRGRGGLPESLTPDRRWLRLGAAVLLTLAVVAIVIVVTHKPPPPSRSPDSLNLVVLPLTVIGTQADKRFFSQGLTETLNSQLSRLTLHRKLQIASAGDVRTRGVRTTKDAREQLGANAALSCSLQYAAIVEISCALLDTASGKALSIRTATADASNPLVVQDRIIEVAIGLIGLSLENEERSLLATHGTQQPNAYDFYLQGRGYLLNFDRAENLDSAVSVFRRALEIDPRYALAYAGLGEAYWRKHEATKSVDWVEPARGACEASLGMDSRLAQTHACLGLVLTGEGEYERAASEFSTALDLEPTNDTFYLGLATAYEKLGRPKDAEQTFRRAIALRPNYWGAYNMLGGYFYRLGRHDEAIQMFEQVVALVPDSFRGYANLGAVYFMKDRDPEAVAAFEKSLAIRSNYQAASNLATLYYYSGQYRRSADAFRQALALNASNYQVWINLADTLLWAGDAEESAKAFQRALALAEERARVNPRDASIQMALASCYAGIGDQGRSMGHLKEVLALAPDDPHTLFQLAVFFEHRLKRREDALTWLSKSVARGQTWKEIDSAPALRDLREDLRFQQLRHSREG